MREAAATEIRRAITGTKSPPSTCCLKCCFSLPLPPVAQVSPPRCRISNLSLPLQHLLNPDLLIDVIIDSSKWSTSRGAGTSHKTSRLLNDLNLHVCIGAWWVCQQEVIKTWAPCSVPVTSCDFLRFLPTGRIPDSLRNCVNKEFFITTAPWGVMDQPGIHPELNGATYRSDDGEDLQFSSQSWSWFFKRGFRLGKWVKGDSSSFFTTSSMF